MHFYIKNFIISKYAQMCIKNKSYEKGMELLNYLASEEFEPAETFLKRGKLCRELLMLYEAYSDFTYVINNCTNNIEAYYERMKLNYDMGNFFEIITDANKLLEAEPDNFEYKRFKFIAFICTEQTELAKSYILNVFASNKYKTLHFLFNEAAQASASDEFAKALKILSVVELIDPDNPLKIFNEANIYHVAGEADKEKNMRQKLASFFPKYFISHFRFTDIYEERDLLEVLFLLELKIFDTQNSFAYPMNILEGYKNYMEGHITDAKEAFERAVKINPKKPEAYVLLAQTYQLMSGYDNSDYKTYAEENYRIAMEIYKSENLTAKMEYMKRQIKHLNSSLTFQ